MTGTHPSMQAWYAQLSSEIMDDYDEFLEMESQVQKLL